MAPEEARTELADECRSPGRSQPTLGLKANLGRSPRMLRDGREREPACRIVGLVTVLMMVAMALPAHALPISATWSELDGSWGDSTGWTFSTPPTLASIPNNDVDDNFDVLVDGTGAGGAMVRLDQRISIATLEVSAGGRVEIGAGGVLRFDGTGGSNPTGTVLNNGVIRFMEPQAAPIDIRMSSAGPLAFSGTGVFDMGEFGNLIINHDGELRNEVGHTIRGGGIFLKRGVQTSALTNAGTIEQVGSTAFTFSGHAQNEGVLRATGSGGLIMDGMNNTGLIEIGPGSRLETRGASRITNFGRISIRGAGTTADFGYRVRSGAEMEVSDGANVNFVSSGGLGGLTIRNASVSATTGGGGSVSLDQANLQVTSTTGSLVFSGGELSGTGTLAVVDGLGQPGSVTFEQRALLTPGTTTSPGVLEIDASAILSREWQSDIFSATADGYDRLVVTGDVLFPSLASATLRFDDLYTPGAGDQFDLLRAPTITGLTDATFNRFGLPSLDEQNLYYDIGVRRDLASDVLSVGIAAPIQATWNGGSGSYGTGGNWNFDVTPDATTIPDGTNGQPFDVTIDTAPTPSLVNLDQRVVVSRLRVGSGDELVVGATGTLRFEAPIGQRLARILDSDGLVRLDGGRIEASQDSRGLALRGAGTLDLGRLPGSVVEMAGRSGGALSVDAGFTVRGVGTVSTSRGIANDGLVVADGDGVLAFQTGSGVFENRDRIEVRPNAVLTVDGMLDSSGTIRIDAGGSLGVFRSESSTLGFVNSGEITVAGSLSSGNTILNNAGLLTFSSGSSGRVVVTNTGTLVVDAGSVVTAPVRYAQSAPTAVTRIAGTLDLASSASFSINEGAFVLDGGRVQGDSRFFIFQDGSSLRGSGEIDVIPRFATVAVLGELSPGENGLGEIVFSDDLAFSTATVLRLDVGGSAGSLQQDVVRVLGTSVLRGTVELDVLDGYVPTAGDSFDVLIAATIDDRGFSFIAPELAGGLSFLATIVEGVSDSRLRVQVVPEPSAALLMGLGLVALVLFARGPRFESA